MATNIEIVIKGTDAFSPAFETLDGALERLETAGGAAGETLAGLQGAFSGVAGGATEAGRSATEFTRQVSENLLGVAESQAETLDALAQTQQQAASTMGERLLEIDAAFQERRAGQAGAAQARLREQIAAHQAAVEQIMRGSLTAIQDFESAVLSARLARFASFFQALSELAASQGGAMAGFAKTLAVGEALLSAYLAANRALAGLPYPFNLAAAALVLAQGLANVQKIREVNVAHGGLENVPEDATFLLRQGERVLSPSQNRDLTGFLRQPRAAVEGGLRVENLTIHVLENATAGEALLTMDAADLRRVVAEKFLPALDDLARLGIRPGFTERNT